MRILGAYVKPFHTLANLFWMSISCSRLSPEVINRRRKPPSFTAMYICEVSGSGAIWLYRPTKCFIFGKFRDKLSTESLVLRMTGGQRPPTGAVRGVHGQFPLSSAVVTASHAMTISPQVHKISAGRRFSDPIKTIGWSKKVIPCDTEYSVLILRYSSVNVHRFFTVTTRNVWRA